jgi:hypothetical protein
VNAPAPAKPNLDKLRAVLFSADAESVYAILDGASVPELLPKLKAAMEEHVCLYRGALEPDMAEVAPYLVKLRRESPFTGWILNEGWGNHWGIFLTTPAGIEALRRHLRQFLRVRDHTDQVLYFRYYDPRVLRVYLPTCRRNENKNIYGPITRFIAEEEETGNALVFPYHATRIKAVSEHLAPAKAA